MAVAKLGSWTGTGYSCRTLCPGESHQEGDIPSCVVSQYVFPHITQHPVFMSKLQSWKLFLQTLGSRMVPKGKRKHLKNGYSFLSTTSG